MGVVKGWFYLKKTATGNLIGEFSNNSLNHVVTECCNLVSCHQDSFIGTYHSVWSENSLSDRFNLTIELKSNSSSIYELIWQKGTSIVYQGEGFIVDGILIGRYESLK